MQRVLPILAIGCFLTMPVVAQRGGGFHGGMGGGFHGGMGGGFHGGMGGFHGGGFVGRGPRGFGGFHSFNGFRGGFRGNRFFFGYYYPWSYWPYYYSFGPYNNYPYYYPYSYPYYDYGYTYNAPDPQQADQPPTNQKTVYLIKLKDQDNVCAAQTYWYTGQVLHFITLDGDHKQVPVSSIDRALTLQLNYDRHVDFQLPY